MTSCEVPENPKKKNQYFSIERFSSSSSENIFFLRIYEWWDEREKFSVGEVKPRSVDGEGSCFVSCERKKKHRKK